jgi:hypothetical protein
MAGGNEPKATHVVPIAMLVLPDSDKEIEPTPGSLLLAAGATRSLNLGIAQPGSRQILSVAVLWYSKNRTLMGTR